MSTPIIVFYHAVLCIGNPPKILPEGVRIVSEQMEGIKKCGLLDAAMEFHVGLNGGPESKTLAELLFPKKAQITFHSCACRNENRTMLMVQEWAKETIFEAYIFYAHCKGASHPKGDPLRSRWRNCMYRNVILEWRKCYQDLESYEAVGCHWMEPPSTPEGQYIFAGNYWACRASFLRTLPSIMERERIKMSGLDSLESKYEAEVILGFGPRRPRVKDYHGPNWNPGMTATCTP